MYHDLAHLWPVVSPPEEYAVEAWHLREVILARLGPGTHTLLELGVGVEVMVDELTTIVRVQAQQGKGQPLGEVVDGSTRS